MKIVVKFLIMTFIITYISHFTLAFLVHNNYTSVETLVGLLLLIIGGSAPTIVTFYLVVKHYSNRERKIFFKKLFNFKHPPFYWLFIIFVPLGIGVFVNLIVYGDLNHVTIASREIFLLPLFMFNGIIFGGLEEVGWRGLLMDKLKRKSSILIITLLIGLIWAFWHLPMFFIDGLSHNDYAFLPYLLAALMYSGFLTYIVLCTRSIALVIIMHAMINVSAALGLSIPFENSFFVYLSLMFLIMITFYLIYPIRRIT